MNMIPTNRLDQNFNSFSASVKVDGKAKTEVMVKTTRNSCSSLLYSTL